MLSLYLAVKALHLIAMVAWFAAVFYLPRIFVYMLEHPKASPTLHIMARKLSHYIMVPALIATWVFGHVLIYLNPVLMNADWLHLKLIFVCGLIAYTASLETFRLRLLKGTNTRSSKFFRAYNEVPTLILIITIFLAVFKPF